jgi:signal transduction histidine kinase
MFHKTVYEDVVNAMGARIPYKQKKPFRVLLRERIAAKVDKSLMKVTDPMERMHRQFGVREYFFGSSLEGAFYNMALLTMAFSQVETGRMTKDSLVNLLTEFNLICNAIKYTPDGGEITIGGRCLPGFAELVIADTGIGIPVRDQTRIFETFGRVGDALLHSSGKTKFRGGGPGLGLPIARGILEAHGGAIWAESPGRDEETCPGSTFHLLIPLRQSEPAGPSLLRRPSAPSRPDASSGA